MPRYDTILYDLDGTLIDSVRLILDSYHHTLEAHGLAPRSDDYWLRGLGTPLRAQFAEWSHDEDTLETMVATYRAYNLARHDEAVSAYPGILETVLAVRRAGCRTGLVTSKNRHGAVRGLTCVGLEETFDVLVCADDVERPKPHPEPVHRALDQLGADAVSTVFVGDSVHDMAAGRAAGVATGAVLWGPFDREDLLASDPDHWLEQPEDLLDCLGIDGGDAGG
jgi:pyrophosphatase PpaX